MSLVFARLTPVLLTAFFICGAASAETITLGFVAFNASAPPFAEVDITNATGPNSSIFPDGTFPVVTPVSLTDFGLTVQFEGGVPAPEKFGRSYFTLAADGLSYDGEAIFPYSGNVLPGDADFFILTGKFVTTNVTLNDGSTVVIDPSFTATIHGGLDGDFGLIQANVTSSTATPEPSSWFLCVACFAFPALRSRGMRRLHRNGLAIVSISACALLATVFPSAASAAVHLNQWTTPDSGAAGATVWVTGSSFPSKIGDFSVSLQTACGTTEGAVSGFPGRIDKLIGTSMKVEIVLPLNLGQGTYFAQINGTDGNGVPFSSNCSKVAVRPAAVTPTGCSLTSNVLTGSAGKPGSIPVSSYIPVFYGVYVIPIEGSGTQKLIRTSTSETMCTAIPSLGRVLCTAIPAGCPLDSSGDSPCPTQFLLIDGTSIVQTSGTADTVVSFAVNPVAKQAVLISRGRGFSGPEVPPTLNTSWSIFDIPSNSFIFNYDGQGTSEGFATPGDGNIFDPSTNRTLHVVLDNASNSVLRVNQLVGSPAAEIFTSNGRTADTGILAGISPVGEDCASRVVVSTTGFNLDDNRLLLTSLADATFETSGTWSSTNRLVTIPEVDSISSAAVVGSGSHLAILSGAFLTNTLGVLRLSSQVGLADYAIFQVPNLPANPLIGDFNVFTSPNSGKDYGVIRFFQTSNRGPFALAVIDMQAALAAPRQTGSHFVQANYDLLGNGVVRFIQIPAASTFP